LGPVPKKKSLGAARETSLLRELRRKRSKHLLKSWTVSRIPQSGSPRMANYTKLSKRYLFHKATKRLVESLLTFLLRNSSPFSMPKMLNTHSSATLSTEVTRK
jgi:hypothetical protein